MKKQQFSKGLIALAIALTLTGPAFPHQLDRSGENRPAAAVVDSTEIPYERFTLANGLRVLVHTDRKAPVVAVSVWFDVGSKHEPKGKTGFAHLFEHLMFNGSENADGDWFEPMAQIGATGVNGTTWFDRTNYYQTVPVGALERTLYLESDRMGHLLGAVTQEKLSNQIGVVQNEKRQSDNKPFGLVNYAQTEALFAPDHPYGHSTIGSMSDLSAASLSDVKQWFRDHYGPNNAVIVLAGDIDAATAKPLLQRFFGHIPRGPSTKKVIAPVPSLKQRTELKLKDRVSTTRLYRTWVVPGLNDPDDVPLSLGAAVLGGLASSRLDNALVRDEQLAVGVTAGVQSFAQLGQFEVTVDVKPDQDPAAVGRRLDQLIGELIAKGPTKAELNRVVTGWTLGTIAGLETVNGKATRLAEGELYSGDPNHFAKQLDAANRATPRQVQAAMAKWLSRPVLAVTVEPGARDAYADAPVVPAVKAAAASEAPVVRVERDAIPAIGELRELAFPKIERATLSNGIQITYARRNSVPLTTVSLSFDAGTSADPRDKLGLAAMTSALLKEGTTNLSSRQIAEREEELGISIGAGLSVDRAGITLSGLSSSVEPGLELMADILLRPGFAEREVARIRSRQLAQIASETTNPGSMAGRVMAPALYGAASPYGGQGSGTEASVKGLTSADVVAFHSQWYRPEKAKLFVVSDLPLSKLAPRLEARFGKWAGQGAAGVKSFSNPPPAMPKILLVDRKDSPQSQISAAMLLPLDPKAQMLDLEAASDILGGNFLSRINMDLRETKGWSYGVRASVSRREHAVTFNVSAPVQADRTGDAIAALQSNFRDFLGPKGVTTAEIERTVNSGIRELPGAFETGNAVMGAMQGNDMFDRPDDYYEKLPAKYRALSQPVVDRAARQLIDPSKLLWVVVGDAKVVRPQLEKLEMPIEQVEVQ